MNNGLTICPADSGFSLQATAKAFDGCLSMFDLIAKGLTRMPATEQASARVRSLLVLSASNVG